MSVLCPSHARVTALITFSSLLSWCRQRSYIYNYTIFGLDFLELFQRQRWRSFSLGDRVERTIMGFSERLDTILN